MRVFCRESDRSVRIETVAQMLSTRSGGMYVSENTFILNFDPKERSGEMVMALDADSVDGYMLVARGLVHENHTHVQVDITWSHDGTMM